MNKKNKFTIRKRIHSFGFAFKGIAVFLKNEHNAWIHSFAAIAAIIMGIILDLSKTEWCLVVIAIAMVFVAEIANTAIEKLVDLASPGQNSKAAKIKDMAAGSVLVAAIAAAIIGMLVFLPKIGELVLK